MDKLGIAVIGAGLIGRAHIELASSHPNVTLVAVVDPDPAGEALARAAGVPWFSDHRQMLDRVRPRAAIVSTPNVTHAAVAVDCMEAGAAVLVEKPIANTLEDAQRICETSLRTGRPALVGHQRRHNPIIARARSIIGAGELGRLVSATVMCTWLKPGDYFDATWRREPGGGPLLINLIHDIDLLRFLYGEIESVQAMTSNAVRGFEVEDTAVVVCRFCNGALGTITVSDTAAAPWNWDLAAGEAARFPRQDVDAYFLSGTQGSLTLPRLGLWRYRGGSGWQEPLTMERTALHAGCPYTEQLRQFRAVVEGRENPLCSALDGARTLEATLAVAKAASTGGSVGLAG